MLSSNQSIAPLPTEVAKQISSSVTITSLDHVIIGLVKNSLDAGARKIDVEVDYRRGACTVEDDGQGILAFEFLEGGGLAKPYHTSRSSSSNITYGLNGTFLSSIAALSILTVTSHHHTSRVHATLVMHNSRPAARLVPAPAYHQLLCREHGTKVGIQNLFSSMPVRVKQRSLECADPKEIERQIEFLRRGVVALLLAWSRPVKISVWVPGNRRRIHVNIKNALVDPPIEVSDQIPAFNIHFVRSMLSQSNYIDPCDWDSWVEVSARTSSVTVEGAISLQPAPSKRVQFMSLGIKPIDHGSDANILLDEINSLFASSNFGRQEKVSSVQEDHALISNQKQGRFKGVDRWPMFYIRICFQEDQVPPLEEREPLAKKQNTLSAASKLITVTVNKFLEDHHFQHRRRSYTKPQEAEYESTSDPAKTLSRLKMPRDEKRTGGHSLHLRNTNVGVWGNAQYGQYSSRPATSSTDISITGCVSTPDTLGSHVIMPERLLQRAISMNDAFSSWSRIKSGKRNALEELLSIPSPLPLTCDQAEPCNDVGTRSAQSERVAEGTDGIEFIDANPAREFQPESPANYAATNLSCDGTISWTNPLSKATVHINSRTGLATMRPLKRPYSRSLDNVPKFQSHARVKRPSTLNRKIRSSSDPVTFLETGSWASDLLKAWVNPIFCSAEEPVPRLCFPGPTLDAAAKGHHCPQMDIQSAFTQSSSSSFTKLSKEKLQAANVLAQIEKKFIFVSMSANTLSQTVEQGVEPGERLLVLIDQHAADERIRVECLLAELCKPVSSSHELVSSKVGAQSLQSAVATTRLPQPIMFEIPAREQRLFLVHAKYLANWGILFDLKPIEPSSREPAKGQCRIFVKALPEAIAERCRLDPKLLIQLIRSELWKRDDSDGCQKHMLSNTTAEGAAFFKTSQESWLARIHDCPQGIIEMVNSRACRSAIMFNDHLSREECSMLVKTLASCAFPFQCAHGRPSMIPLADLATATLPEGASKAFETRRAAATRADEEPSFQQAWTKWKDSRG
ncbi:MAG: hypothetical protein Q9191_003374 [Dirinaria sp. TL-2023a]